VPDWAQQVRDELAELGSPTAAEARQITGAYDPADVAAALHANAVEGSSAAGGMTWALVRYAGATITSWDGSAVPFNDIVYDPDGLWESEFDQFTCKTAGWYRIWTQSSNSGGVIAVPAAANNGTNSIVAQVYGAGDNITSGINHHTAVTTGPWVYPHIYGITHLDAADGIALVGDSVASTTIGYGLMFGLELLAAT